MKTKVLSKFFFLLEKDDFSLIYNARTNNFYKITASLAKIIENCEDEECIKNMDEEALALLDKMKVIVDEHEDEDYFESLKLKYYINQLANNHLTVTVAPTVYCNLKCPYCYEHFKPTGKMTKEVCDAVVRFINDNPQTNSYSVTWYGGEPLLCIEEIEYILEQLKESGQKKMTGHGIVTNGVLLKDKAITLFKRFPLNSVQITLDGVKEHHDRTRIRHDSCGTFDEIIANLTTFVRECPQTRISIRVNIDKSNANQFHEVKQYISALFPDKKNIQIYPGILRGDTDCHSENIFLQNKDVLKLYQSMAAKGVPIEIYPKLTQKGCTATCLMGFVIGPKGELYNCWEDMGNEKLAVGNLIERKLKEKEMRRYILHGHPFEDAKCKNCRIFPICYGGCPKRRLENIYRGGNNELCSMYKDNDYEGLKNLLFEFYKNKETYKSLVKT